MSMAKRSVFIVSDGTGITAEILGHSLLSQFPDTTFHTTALPFVDSDDKVADAVRQINQAAAADKAKPLVFTTFVRAQYTNRLRSSHSVVLDLFGTFLDGLAAELDMTPSRQVGYGHGVVDTDRYTSRIRAVHYSMDCDDGINTEDYRRRRFDSHRGVKDWQNAGLPIFGHALWSVLRQLPPDGGRSTRRTTAQSIATASSPDLRIDYRS